MNGSSRMLALLIIGALAMALAGCGADAGGPAGGSGTQAGAAAGAGSGTDSGSEGGSNADHAAGTHTAHADHGAPDEADAGTSPSESSEPAAAEPAQPEPAYTIDAEIEQRDDGYYLHVTTNLTLSTENYGLAHVEGEGHIHLYINGSLIGPIVDLEPVLLDRLKEGRNEVRVALAKNNHSLYAGASKTIEVDVAAVSDPPAPQDTAS